MSHSQCAGLRAGASDLGGGGGGDRAQSQGQVDALQARDARKGSRQQEQSHDGVTCSETTVFQAAGITQIADAEPGGGLGLACGGPHLPLQSELQPGGRVRGGFWAGTRYSYTDL